MIDLKQARKKVEDLKHRFLFDEEVEGMNPFAEQEFLQALYFLDLASSAIAKADLHQPK
jgi:hypothetical protein